MTHINKRIVASVVYSLPSQTKMSSTMDVLNHDSQLMTTLSIDQ